MTMSELDFTFYSLWSRPTLGVGYRIHTKRKGMPSSRTHAETDQAQRLPRFNTARFNGTKTRMFPSKVYTFTVAEVILWELQMNNAGYPGLRHTVIQSCQWWGNSSSSIGFIYNCNITELNSESY